MTPTGEAESLNQRIRNAAAREGVPPIRLRNRVAFQRLLARLALADGWVLKGGFSLEVRLGLIARATKDLDLLHLAPAPGSALDLQDLLDAALETELDDGFAFRVRLPTPVRLEEAEPSTWRAIVDVRFDGSAFGTIAIDIVPTTAIETLTSEVLRIDSEVVGDPFDIAALDVHRHMAEKFHAYARIYAYERPSSRVKDLVDIVLLAQSGLIDDARLNAALLEVFAERDTALPGQLPAPPGDWRQSFAALAEGTGSEVTDLGDARQIATELYDRARAHESE